MSAHYTYKDHLESERLITRFLTTEDMFIWDDFFKDKEAVEYLPTFGMETIEEKAKYWIDKQLNRYKENKFGLQALIDKKSNNFIGQCGLIKQEVDGQIEIEVGYHVFKKYWGQGYAPEAARIFIDYAFKNNITDSVISIIDIRNIKSQKVAIKNGLNREKQTKWVDLDVFIYRIIKPDRNVQQNRSEDPFLDNVGHPNYLQEASITVSGDLPQGSLGWRKVRGDMLYENLPVRQFDSLTNLQFTILTKFNHSPPQALRAHRVTFASIAVK